MTPLHSLRYFIMVSSFALSASTRAVLLAVLSSSDAAFCGIERAARWSGVYSSDIVFTVTSAVRQSESYVHVYKFTVLMYLKYLHFHPYIASSRFPGDWILLHSELEYIHVCLEPWPSFCHTSAISPLHLFCRLLQPADSTKVQDQGATAHGISLWEHNTILLVNKLGCMHTGSHDKCSSIII